MRDFDDELERAIGARFGALHGSVVAAVPLPRAEEIVARGRRRRRNGQAALGGLAVLAVLAVASVLFGPFRPDGAPLPLVDPPLTTQVYVPPAGALRAPLGDTIPAGFLPGEARAGDRLPSLCAGSNFTTDATIRAAAATLDGPVTLRVLVYPVGMTASRAFGEYRAEARRCAGAAAEVETLGFGAEGFTLVTTRPAHHLVVVRYGRSLLIAGGPTAQTVLRAGVVERSLCVFATDCGPRQGLPGALPSLAVGGPAWAAVLAMSTSPDDPELGRAVATASTLGYRTSVTSVGCDDGARERFGLPVGSPHRYVPVYFPTRTDAETFAVAVKGFAVTVIQVRTYCLG